MTPWFRQGFASLVDKTLQCFTQERQKTPKTFRGVPKNSLAFDKLILKLTDLNKNTARSFKLQLMSRKILKANKKTMLPRIQCKVILCGLDIHYNRYFNVYFDYNSVTFCIIIVTLLRISQKSSGSYIYKKTIFSTVFVVT